MEIIGIVGEYNPFHNGHIYHIEKIKELYPDSLIILVLNGYFMERGEISLLTKEEKTKIALNNNIDLVIELPTLFGTQSADTFANTSIKLLNELKVNKIVFGSEIDDIKKLEDIADKQLNDDSFNDKVKEYLKTGLNYPTALSKAIGIDFEYNPNDLLGISYIKAIKANNYDIEPICIKRTSEYHDLDSTSDIISASNIRNKFNNDEDIKKYLPQEAYKLLKKCDEDELYNLLKYHLILNKDISMYLDVSEGIDYLLREQVVKSNSLKELIDNVKSKRYTYNKISRMLTHILLGITKEDAKEELKYMTILGFNKAGKKYLNSIKKDIILPIKKDFDSVQYKIEYNAAFIYDIVMDADAYDFEKQNKPIFVEK